MAWRRLEAPAVWWRLSGELNCQRRRTNRGGLAARVAQLCGVACWGVQGRSRGPTPMEAGGQPSKAPAEKQERNDEPEEHQQIGRVLMPLGRAALVPRHWTASATGAQRERA